MAKKSVKSDIWERQPNESSQAYEAFAAYRDMGAERSLRAVSQKLGKSRTLIDRWSRTWNWVERARAWDSELARQAREEAGKKVKEMTGRHINIAMQLQKKALEALAAVDLDAMQPKDILAFIKEAANMERLNRMEDAGITPGGGRSAGPGSPAGQTSLADAIMQAYAQRKEGGDDD